MLMLSEMVSRADRFFAKRPPGADWESGVIRRYRKMGGTLEESARSAQRGLLVILAAAMVWALAIWIGYRLL